MWALAWLVICVPVSVAFAWFMPNPFPPRRVLPSDEGGV